ncbi:hypothetical protein [Paludibacterium denitrificans]|uniref:hypothetical protein n=1 Tax=Paludibacterium denitrificans TaxID=2675226 RepID=UPI001E46ABEC|nr:hypothetical protein [Paludibacterium denitrificans]
MICLLNVQATGTITLTGTVTRAGTMYAYVGGNRVSCAAAYNDSNATVATNPASAINANADIPATATAQNGVVTVKANHKGSTSNGMELAVTYYDDDTLPNGITAVCSNLSGGTGDPDVGAALAVISEDWYYSIIEPYTDSANLAELEADMDGRWSGMNMKTGHIFNAKDGTMASLTTWGATRNSPHCSTGG